MKQKLRKTAKALLPALIIAAAALPFAALAAETGSVELSWWQEGIVVGVQAIVQMIVGMLGKLTVQLIHILILVAGYNGYMDSPAVTTGWIIVRDVANLFLVAVILVISIGSIVRPERFGGAKKIFMVLVYAVFVNFSRTITAFFIDISQLVMLTFVNGFAAAAGGNFVEALGIQKLTDVRPENSPLTFSSLLGALFLALIMFVIITVIIAVMVVALVIRMVMLWMLIVLAPIAFAMAPYERTHEYYAKWWKDLEKQLTAGPIVAFFLWLSLVSFQGSTGSDLTGQNLMESQSAVSKQEAPTINCGDTIACSEENMIRFIVATVMLLAGLSFAQEFGGVGGAMAGQALAAGKRYASSAVRFTARKAALPVAAVATGGIAGAAVVGGIAFARTQRGKGMIGRAGVGLGRGVSNLQDRLNQPGAGNFVGRWALRAAGVGAMGRAVGSFGGKQLAEADKKARENMANLSPAQVEEVLRSSASNYADRRAAALRIATDRDYREAPNDPAHEHYHRYQALDQSMAFLGDIENDKDASEARREVRRVHPELRRRIDWARVAGEFDPREGASRVRLDLMSEAHRNAFLGNMREDVRDDFYNRTNTVNKNMVDGFRRGNALTGAPLQAAVRGNTLNIEQVPLERHIPGAPIPPGAHEPPTEVNLEFARTVLEHGNREQRERFLGRDDIADFRDAMRDALRTGVNFNTHAGFTGAGANDRLNDNNLRLAETTLISGMPQRDPERMASLRDIFRVNEDGNIIDDRMRNSLQASMHTAPNMVDLVMSLPQSVISGTNGANDVTNAVADTLTAADLEEMAARSVTPADAARLRSLIQNLDDITQDATQQMARRQRVQTLMQHVANHPDLASFVP